MHANIDPSQFPTVTEVSAPAFSGPAHRLTHETQNAAPSSASASQIAESPVTAVPKTMSLPKPKAAPAHLLRPEQPFSQYTSWTCHNPSQEYVPDGPTQMMLSQESDWLAHQKVLCKSGPKPWYAPKDYGASTELATHEPPVMLVIPPDVVAEEVNLDTFPTFEQWKDAMWHAPYVASHKVEEMTSYKPISYNIVGFDGPVNQMSDQTPPSDDHVFTPILWISDYVQPPYEDFYLDGCRIPPYGTGLTGYETLPLSYKGPMVEEEYWNRMIALWRSKNDLRREKARMIAQLKGVSLEYGEFGDVPMYRKVPVTHRVRRFQLGKLAIILKELKEAEEATIKADEVADDPSESSPPMSTTPIPVTAPSEVIPETSAVAESETSANLENVRVDEVHEAQIAALPPADGSAASASEHPAMSTPRRNQQKMNQKSPRGAMSALPTVREDSVPPSAPDSFRSLAPEVEETDAVEVEQSEQVIPPDE
eukprot:3742143-Amphidinium_carterae.1